MTLDQNSSFSQYVLLLTHFPGFVLCHFVLLVALALLICSVSTKGRSSRES